MPEREGRRPIYKRGLFWTALALVLLLVLEVALLFFTLPHPPGEETTIGRFYDLVEDEKIERMRILERDQRTVFISEGTEYWVSIPDSEEYKSVFVDLATRNDIPLDIDQQSLKGLMGPASSAIVPTLLLVTAILFAFQVQRGGGGFLRSSAKRAEGEKTLTFADVAGVDEAIAEIREVRDYLLDPQRFIDVGAEPPRGILLAGPPGTGKTLLARALAGEADVPFFSISGADFIEMYVGVGAARVRDLFEQVRQKAPAILFIDELDALGRTRAGSSAAGHDEQGQTLNQLLVELDGFDRSLGVVLVGATNRPDVLDPALLRRGRFDRHIVVDRPDRAGREAILKVHAHGKRLHSSVSLRALAWQTSGFTGADLANVLNEAALLAARERKSSISLDDVEEAVERVMLGSERRMPLISAEEKRAIAYHEAGHAVVAWALPHTDPIAKISVVSRGRSLGFVRHVPEEDRLFSTRRRLHSMLAVAMGGRAAELLVNEDLSSGATDDLRTATGIARRMVCEYGMSDALGPRSLGRRTSRDFLDDDAGVPDYSDEVAAEIDREIGRFLEGAQKRAAAALRPNRVVLDELAAELMEQETLREGDLASFAARVTRAEAPVPPSTPAQKS